MSSNNINFTRDDLAAAIKDARSKVEQGSAWARSIDRAEKNLAGGKFLFDGRYVVLGSATSNKRYTLDTVEPIVCPCKDQTGKCWHITAARLIVRAAEKAALRAAIAAIPATPDHLSPDEYIDMLAMQQEESDGAPLPSFDDAEYAELEALAAECY
jgi:hypothetical protein